MIKKSWLLKILTIGLYSAPFSIFVFYQKTLYPMATLKFTVFYIITELLLAAWLWLILWYPEYRLRKGWLLASVFILLNVLFVTSMMGINPARSFWSTPDRLSGLFSLLHFFAYFLILYSLRAEFNWQKYFKTLFWISVVVALFVLVQKIAPGFFLSGEASRPGSFIGNPALLAGYLIFNIFLGGWIAATSSGKERLLYAAASGYEIIAIFLGGTRGALIGVTLGAIVLLVMLAWPKLKPFSFKASVAKNPALLILLAAILFSGIFFMTRTAPVWQKISGLDRLALISTEDGAIGDRLVAWEITLKSFKEHPVFGNGWENFKYSFDANYDPRLFRNGVGETFWDRPHNVFLEYLDNAGIVGLLAYLGVFVSAFYVIIKKSSKKFRPFGVGLLVAYLAQNALVFDSFGTYLMLFVLLAYLASLEAESVAEPAPATKLSSIGNWAAFLIGLILIVSALWTNMKILYANNLEYWGINYMTQKFAVEGIESFRRAVTVNQPYANDVRLKQLQLLVRTSGSVDIPDITQNFEFAITELKKAIATDPFNYYLYYSEADAKVVFRSLTVQYYKDAETAIRKALALSPNRQQSLYVLAKIRFLFGDQAGAVAILKSTVELDEQAADPHYYYALLLWNTDNKNLAVTEFKRAVELGYRPKDQVEAKQLGDIFADSDDYPNALKFYQAAIDYDNEDIDANLKKGLVYMFMGNSAGAKPYLQRVLELMPDLKSNPSFLKFKPYFESVGL